MGFFSFFKQKILKTFSRWRELGSYRSEFTAFGGDIYRSEIVRSCIRPLADFTSKANARCSDPKIEHILNGRPNLYMNGKEFLAKVRNIYELKNNVMIYIQRDERGKVSGLYPVPYSRFEALEYANGLFIRFHFDSRSETLTVAWDDLAVIRKDYVGSDICGDENLAILRTLDLINVTNEGLSNAVRATANLRGILKSTKAMLSPADVKRQKEEFVADYLNLENEGGIASLDATQEFTPISMSPVVASIEQMKEFRENVQRYFGVNDEIIMASAAPDRIESFYETRIEPFLVDLSTELTAKIFTERERAFGAWIVYEANKLQFASLDKKIALFQTVVLYGGMTVNEWRLGCNMAPVEGGDEMIRRLDAAPVADGGQSDGEN